MLVQCPKCKTTYKVSEDKVSDDIVKETAPAFRCSRCKHTFQFQGGMENSPQAAGETAGTAQKNNLAFTFEPVTPPENVPGERDALLQAESSSAKTAHLTNLHGAERIESANSSVAQDVRTPETEVQPAEPVKQPPYSSAQPSRESAEKVLKIGPYREQRASVMPFLTLFSLFTILAFFIFAYQKIHPAAAESWMARIPLLGSSGARNDRLKDGVLLKSVETRFQMLQGNREAVVLTGIAVNSNPIMIRNVQLSAQLFDQEGKEVERQTMWIGNAISLQIIRGMTAQDVTDLQRLKPLKTFEIPPGDSVNFAIVFLRPGKTLKDAGCEVLSVEAV